MDLLPQLGIKPWFPGSLGGSRVTVMFVLFKCPYRHRYCAEYVEEGNMRERERDSKTVAYHACRTGVDKLSCGLDPKKSFCCVYQM